MFERVDMDVIPVRTKIRAIPNQMLPIAALPYAAPKSYTLHVLG